MRTRHVLLAAAVAAATLIAVPTASGADGAEVIPTTPSGTAATQAAVSYTVPSGGISGVRVYTGDGVKGYHVTGLVTYQTTPPIGGPHNSIWANAGVYTQPIPNERAVHDLEHGAIWILYRPGLAASSVGVLTSFVGRQTTLPEQATPSGQAQRNRFMLMSPWKDDSLPAPIVMVSWGHMLLLSSSTDSRMQAFVNTYRRNKTYSPEYTEPVDNQPIHIAGNPAQYGGTAPNPA